MTALPTDEWTTALDQMSAAIGGQIADLDARQRAAKIDTETSDTVCRPEELLEWMEQRLEVWDRRLQDAADVAATVVKQLGERENALIRWHEHLVRWQKLIQQNVVPTDTSPGFNRSE